MGEADNGGCFGLPKNLGEAEAGSLLVTEKVREHVTRANRWKLIRVANKQDLVPPEAPP